MWKLHFQSERSRLLNFHAETRFLPKGHLWTHSESAVHLHVWNTLSSLVNTGLFQLCKMQSRLGNLHLTKASFLRDKQTKKKPQCDKTKAISWGSCCNLLPTHGCQLLPASLLPTPVVRQGRGPSWTPTTPAQRFSAGWISSCDLTDEATEGKSVLREGRSQCTGTSKQLRIERMALLRTRLATADLKCSVMDLKCSVNQLQWNWKSLVQDVARIQLWKLLLVLGKQHGHRLGWSQSRPGLGPCFHSRDQNCSEVAVENVVAD